METKFYTGNYSLTLGQPYVIISASESQTDFTAEKIIIFEGFNGQQIILGNRVKYPKISNRSLEDFISSEVQVCKDDIFYKILFTKYKTELEQRNYNVNIELRETNTNIISLLRDKFPRLLTNIKNNTMNEKLNALIGLYQSIVIERNDFDINK
ncbi:MAG: hypothetical protein IM571_04895 [Chitinophagaceae bacterium]|nr:hypothetical protein [Chitinophagaceae bacterium]MCA6469023.1 hypothetical protein [Chitinophagaceae bacterium]MCA6477272.1 hypothetical protein [Chitinophagaceae bacterium]